MFYHHFYRNISLLALSCLPIEENVAVHGRNNKESQRLQSRSGKTTWRILHRISSNANNSNIFTCGIFHLFSYYNVCKSPIDPLPSY